jgi:excisionase family DNA binding protein
MSQPELKTTKLLVTKREAAAALSISIRTVENFIRRKELVARKIGRRTLIPLSALASFARRDHESPLTGHDAS